VDVDGDDEVVFGGAQFTEGDILGHPEGDIQIDGDTTSDEDEDGITERKTLRDLVAEGKVVRRRVPGVDDVKVKMEEVMGVGDADKMDLAVNSARKHGNSSALILALENKIKQLVSLSPSSCSR
jgi:hypothetical protein